MYHKDSPTQREEERRATMAAVRDEIQAAEERQADTISKRGGFHNDPDVPTNPNEVRERYLRKLRTLRLC